MFNSRSTTTASRPGRRRARALIALAAVTLAALASAGPALAVQSDNFWEAPSLSTDANGDEVAYADTQTLVRSTGVFDTSRFTLEMDGEGLPDSGFNRTGCALAPSDPGYPGYSYGGKSSWTRFVSAVPGTASFTVHTTYDVIVHVYRAPDAIVQNWRPHTVKDVNCSNVVAGPNEVITNVPVQPGQPIYLQTLGLCGRGASPPAGCPDPSLAQGGATDVTMTFVPDPAPPATIVDPSPATGGVVDPGTQPASGAVIDPGTGAAGATPFDTSTAGLLADTPAFDGGPDTGPGSTRHRASVRGHSVVADPGAAAVFKPGQTSTVVRQLTLPSVPKGATVGLRCHGGGCPKSRTVRVRRTGPVRLGRYFGHPLRVDAVIDVRIMRPGATSRLLRYTIRPGAQPAHASLCVSSRGAEAACPAPRS
jgi:hypothetical protein